MTTAGHMYFFGGSEDEPIVTLRYPEYRTARFAEIVQSTAFCQFSSRSRPTRLLRVQRRESGGNLIPGMLSA